MKIIMSKSMPGSIDGIRVSTYVAGTEYDLTGTAGARSLASAFVGSGMAVEVAMKRAPEPVAALEPADEPIVTASIEAAPESPAADTGKRPYNRKQK